MTCFQRRNFLAKIFVLVVGTILFISLQSQGARTRSQLTIPHNHPENFRHLLQKIQNENCTIGSNFTLSTYPSLVSLLTPGDPFGNHFCGGVLTDPSTVLTSAGCIYQKINDQIALDLTINPLNQTFPFIFRAAVAPYCANGFGGELVDILGYHLMEDYNGNVKDGNAVAVLKLKQKVTYLEQGEYPQLRQSRLGEGEQVTMVGHGAITNAQALGQETDYSQAVKIVEYVGISDEECAQLLSQSSDIKQLDTDTESCVVVSASQDPDIGICNGDDGDPLYDENGELLGIVNWWTNNRCDLAKDQSMPVVYSDIAKTKVAQFVEQSKTKSLYPGPNVTQGCENRQVLIDAEYAVSIQFQRPDDSRTLDMTNYVHLCGATLIDNGTRILTAAQCIWNEFFPLQDSTHYVTDFRNNESTSPFTGTFAEDTPLYAALAPLCRHLVGIIDRVRIRSYTIHPLYDGNPQNGYDIAILDLAEAFSYRWSFENFIDQVLNFDSNQSVQDLNFTEIEFFGWGATYPQEAQDDDFLYWNNIMPAKQINMRLLSDDACTNNLIKQDVQNVLSDESSVCGVQSNPSEVTNICMFDVGGPLVGRLNGSRDRVFIGVLSWQQDRACLDSADFPEVFTDVRKVQNFIRAVLRPQVEEKEEDEEKEEEEKPPSDGTPTVLIIIVVIVGVALVALIVAFFMWNRCRWNGVWKGRRKDEMQQQLIVFRQSHQQSVKYQKLAQDISDIHAQLGTIALQHKDPHTGRARRHSALSGQLDHLYSHSALEHQIAGYSAQQDDSIVYGSKGSIITSPFLLAAMSSKKDSTMMSKVQIQRTMPTNEYSEKIQSRLIQLSQATVSGSLISQNSNPNYTSQRVLITEKTPARSDFNMDIDYERDLEVKERLGTGAFGSVYRSYWKPRNMEVAVKVIHAHVLEQIVDDLQQDGNLLNTFVSELNLLARMDSPHIVKCYGGCLKPPNVCVVLELLPNGSLDKFIHTYPGSIPVPLITRMALGIAEGLSALHPTVVHRDLKPQNVLLDNSYNVKLADFGMSKIKEDTYMSETMVKGTPAYIAPEVFKGENVDEKCDVYALGLIMWEMVAKKKPWQDLNLPVVIMAQVAIKHQRPEIPSSCPKQLKKLIQKCWAPNPKDRPTAHEVAQKLALMRQQNGENNGIGDNTQLSSKLSGMYLSETSNEKTGQSVIDYDYSQFSINTSVNSLQVDNDIKRNV